MALARVPRHVKTDSVSDVSSSEPVVLIVDDLPANLLALHAVLEPLGVPVVEATSGERAMREILNHGPAIAVMLLDVQMPGLDGFETASLIRSRESTRHLPIIFVTAVNREEAHIVKGYANGAVDYLVKPFNPDALRAKVAFFVEAHRRAHARESERLLSKHRLDLAADAAGLGVWGWEASTGTFSCDERCRRLLGVSADDEVKLEALGLSHADTPADGTLRREHLTPSGAWLLVQARVYGDGHRRQLVGVVADISEEKRALTERDLFLGVLGHDLRNPLNVVTLGAITLANHADPAVAVPAKKMERAAHRMSGLISDVLDFVRSRNGGLPLKRCTANLNSICEDVIDEVRAAHPEARITFAASDAADGEWDAARLGQVVQNLITNAIRHGEPEQPVNVMVQGDDDEVVLGVENVGAPISEEVRARIFEPFVSEAGDIGLGLYVAKQLVSAHRGEITAISENHRTTFRVTLPR
jgi:signal transduction histidine kinase